VLDPDGGTSSSGGADGQRARLGAGAHKSQYRGVSFDKKKRKWCVQIKARPRPAPCARGLKSGPGARPCGSRGPVRRRHAGRAARGRAGSRVARTAGVAVCAAPRTRLHWPRLLPHGPGLRGSARPAPDHDRAGAPGGQVATLGKSGVSVGYYDTEEAAARAYDRAAIGLLGRDSAGISTNFALADYDAEAVPQLIGKTREEVKATLKSERAKARTLP